MKVFDRLFAAVLALAVLAAAVLTALVSSDVLSRREITSRWSYAPVEGMTHDLATLDAATRPLVVGVAIGVAVVMLILFLGEFRVLGSIFAPLRRRGRAVPLTSAGPGATSVLIGPLDDIVRRAVSDLLGVSSARARVTHDDKSGLSVLCDASVDASAELPVLAPTVARRITEFLTMMVGLPVKDVRVRISLDRSRAEPPQVARRATVR